MAKSKNITEQHDVAAWGDLRSRLLQIAHSTQFKKFRRMRPSLLDRCLPGVFLVESLDAAMHFAAEAMDDGLYVAWVDGQHVTSKHEFLTLVAQALEFPGYYGRNWDAFDECIRDLEWLPAQGYLLVLDDYDWFAQRDPESWRIALAILKEAVKTWVWTPTPMYVLLRGASEQGLGVSTLECVSGAKATEPSAWQRFGDQDAPASG